MGDEILWTKWHPLGPLLFSSFLSRFFTIQPFDSEISLEHTIHFDIFSTTIIFLLLKISRTYKESKKIVSFILYGKQLDGDFTGWPQKIQLHYLSLIG